MKNVLLPTDLSIASLWPIHQIAKDAGKTKVTIHLVHMVTLPTSITDLLFLNEDKFYKQVPANFAEAMQVFSNKYRSVIHNINFRFIYCNTSRYLRNYLEGHNIFSVYKLNNYEYQLPLDESVKLENCLTKVKVPMHEVAFSRESVSKHLHYTTLLNNERSTLPGEIFVNEPSISYS